MAAFRGLLRELQLQRRVPVSRLKECAVTSRPTELANVALIFHIDNGSYDGTSLDGLNVVLAAHTPGPMADGSWSVAAYIDERANDKQTEALGEFTGSRGRLRPRTVDIGIGVRKSRSPIGLMARSGLRKFRARCT